jgi:hypothetical protein
VSSPASSTERTSIPTFETRAIRTPRRRSSVSTETVSSYGIHVSSMHSYSACARSSSTAVHLGDQLVVDLTVARRARGRARCAGRRRGRAPRCGSPSRRARHGPRAELSAGAASVRLAATPARATSCGSPWSTRVEWKSNSTASIGPGSPKVTCRSRTPLRPPRRRDWCPPGRQIPSRHHGRPDRLSGSDPTSRCSAHDGLVVAPRVGIRRQLVRPAGELPSSSQRSTVRTDSGPGSSPRLVQRAVGDEHHRRHPGRAALAGHEAPLSRRARAADPSHELVPATRRCGAA